jgi:DNA recombination protein RmuC
MNYLVTLSVFAVINLLFLIIIIYLISKITSQSVDTGAVIREEFRNGRDETSRESSMLREAIDRRLQDSLNALIEGLASLGKEQQSRLDSISKASRDLETAQRDELVKIKAELSEHFRLSVENQNRLFNDVINKLEFTLTSNRDEVSRLRDTLDGRFKEIQAGNEKKLEEMRITVDEKLHNTLEKRLGESFKLVSERLEAVQTGLGEMRSLANGVGDLKKVLSNVKSKGVIGEYQLDGLLEQILNRGQYDTNVKTKHGSRDNVEFAVKIPDKNTEDKFIWLPIDAKFPTEDYERLLNAYDAGEKALIDELVKSLAGKIDKFSKDIRDKYIDPPYTTEFAVMFLPFEGLYAEVLRIPGLFEKIQNNKVIITGPSTLAAFLNSLQMGFRTLAIEKRSVEVWQVLGAVKTEFGKFGDVIEQAKKKLDAARDELDKTGTRTRMINSKLKKVESLPETESVQMLGMNDDNEE